MLISSGDSAASYSDHFMLMDSWFYWPGDSVTLLESAKQDIYALCSHVHQFAFDIVFAPLRLHLADVPTMPVSPISIFYFYILHKAKNRCELAFDTTCKRWDISQQ